MQTLLALKSRIHQQQIPNWDSLIYTLNPARLFNTMWCFIRGLIAVVWSHNFLTSLLSSTGAYSLMRPWFHYVLVITPWSRCHHTSGYIMIFFMFIISLYMIWKAAYKSDQLQANSPVNKKGFIHKNIFTVNLVIRTGMCYSCTVIRCSVERRWRLLCGPLGRKSVFALLFLSRPLVTLEFLLDTQTHCSELRFTFFGVNTCGVQHVLPCPSLVEGTSIYWPGPTSQGPEKHTSHLNNKVWTEGGLMSGLDDSTCFSLGVLYL